MEIQHLLNCERVQSEIFASQIEAYEKEAISIFTVYVEGNKWMRRCTVKLEAEKPF